MLQFLPRGKRVRPLGNDVGVSAPARFGRYRVERRIGSGAFATVWLAQDDVLDAPVAVKVLADNWSHRMDIRSRFEEEARILRRADSDRVVRVHDIGELEDGRPYFVMTYADRGSLAERIGDAPLPVADTLRYGADIARGLAVLHQVGVIHRDVNPANILLRTGRDGGERVLIADLGLAKAAVRGSGFTLTVGTPGYTAPEQARPGEHGLDKRADVYSIGAVLHHMLTGVVPEQDEVPLPPRQLRPEVPDAVDAVVRRALAPLPADRFPSAGALADALDRAALDAAAPWPPAHPRPHLPPDLLPRAVPHTPAEDPADEPAATAADPAVGGDAPDEVGERLAGDVERPLGPEDTLTIPWDPPRRRRGRTVAALIAVLVLLGGSGTAVALVLRDRSDIEVSTADGRVRIRVPAAWGERALRSAWDLTYAGPARTGSAVVASPDVTRWGAPGVPGAFAGIVEGVDPAAVLDHSAAAACPEAGTAYELKSTDGTLAGRISHRACPGSDVSYVEAYLQPSDRSFVAYVLVRQPAGTDTGDRIVAGFVVENG
jgi:eukaryotic-like serine/threonine-protein kinase